MPAERSPSPTLPTSTSRSPHRPPRVRAHRRTGVRTTAGILTVTVGLIVGTAACADDDSTAAPTTTAAPATTTAPTATAPSAPAPGNGFPASWRAPAMEWAGCDVGERTECATLTVPLDWSRPDGPTVDLAVARRRATGERAGTLLSNPGGPGASGLELLTYDAFSPTLARRFDLVSWDPRGVGRSTRATCGSTVAPFLADDPDPDTPAETTDLERDAAALATACGARSGALLAHIGTDDVARDLEALRRALGDEPLNFLGFSYGTQIGQRYAEFFPAQVRAMVLDGVVDPRLGFSEFLLGQARAFDDAFERNVEGCRRAGADECGVRDLAGAYDRLMARVEVEPLPAGRRTVGPAELTTAATYVAYLDDGWQELGPALRSALDGDATGVRELADSYYDLDGYPTYAAVTCVDSPPPTGVEEYRRFAAAAEEVSPRFGAAVANELLPCATWPVRSTRTPGPARVTGAPPLLVVGNTGDPATPYSNALTVARDIPGAVLLTVDADGHTAYGSNACATEAVDRYFESLSLPAARTVCR